jgi:hypothetical protein
LANHIDMGGGVSAKVVRILRGHGILSLFFSSFWKTYGCVIEITKHDLNWKEIKPYMDKSRDIEDLINTAKGLEVREVAKAISMYREAAARIVAFDETGPVAALWRRARYPINRLSLLLEKSGHLRDAYHEILQYEQFNDILGLKSADVQSITARKHRLSKKLDVERQP